MTIRLFLLFLLALTIEAPFGVTQENKPIKIQVFDQTDKKPIAETKIHILEAATPLDIGKTDKKGFLEIRFKCKLGQKIRAFKSGYFVSKKNCYNKSVLVFFLESKARQEKNLAETEKSTRAKEDEVEKLNKTINILSQNGFTPKEIERIEILLQRD